MSRDFSEPLIEVSFLKPMYTISKSSNSSTRDLCINAIIKPLAKITLNSLLIGHHSNIFIHLLIDCQDNGFSFMIELRTTCTTEDLLHIKYSDVLVFTRHRIVHLSSLNHDSVGWQVDSPGQSSSGNQDLDMTFHEHLLNQVSVFAQQTCIVNTETKIEKFFNLFIARGLDLLFNLMRVFAIEQIHIFLVFLNHFNQFFGCTHCFSSSMNEYNDLFAHFQNSAKFSVYYIIHYLVCTVCISKIFNSIKSTLKRCRPITGVKKESALSICSNKPCNIFIIRKSGRKTNYSYRFLSFCRCHHGSCNETFKDQTSYIIQQMNFIDNHDVDNFHHTICLSSNNIPLFRCRNYNMCLLYLLF